MSITKQQLILDLQKLNKCSLIARKYHKSPAWVTKYVKKYKINLSNYKQYWISKEQLLDDLTKLKTIRAVANKYNKNPATVYWLIKKYNIKLFKKDNSIYDEKIYHEYYINKKSITQISKILSLSPASIQERFKINKWKLRPRGKAIQLRYRSFTDNDIINLYKKYKSTIAVAAEVGMSSTGIDYILKKHNVKLKGNNKLHKNGGEKLIANWLKSWNINYIMHWSGWDKSKFKYKWHHIDLYIPDYKIFIDVPSIKSF